MKSSRRGGFTLIEVMIAVLIMVIGLVGVMAMQVVAVQANGRSRDATEATAIAEHVAVMLQQDATFWNTATNTGGTSFISEALATPDAWVSPDVSPFGEPVNALGLGLSNLDADDKSAGRAKFCVAMRADWALTGEVVSGHIRVYWPKISGDSPGDCQDAASLDAPGPGSGAETFAFVTIPFAVRRVPL